MELGLTDKVALVAGASRGIGYAAAKQLHDEGAIVAMVGRDASRLLEATRGVSGDEATARVAAFPADVCIPEQVEDLVERVNRQWGRIDILVSAVGQGVRSTIETASASVWEENWRTNLMSAVLLTRTAAPVIQRGRDGCIVLLGAASGIRPTPGQLVSNVHKAALHALGRSLSLELAPQRVRVNVVSPGRIATERRARRAAVEASEAGISQDEYLEKVATAIPLGRLGTPDEVASMIVFLCSSRAQYITGQVIAIDGGLVLDAMS
jgi:3-oxoacyl-[acyl-carrier protein] reductase